MDFRKKWERAHSFEVIFKCVYPFTLAIICGFGCASIRILRYFDVFSKISTWKTVPKSFFLHVLCILASKNLPNVQFGANFLECKQIPLSIFENFWKIVFPALFTAFSTLIGRKTKNSIFATFLRVSMGPIQGSPLCDNPNLGILDGKLHKNAG